MGQSVRTVLSRRGEKSTSQSAPVDVVAGAVKRSYNAATGGQLINVYSNIIKEKKRITLLNNEIINYLLILTELLVNVFFIRDHAQTKHFVNIESNYINITLKSAFGGSTFFQIQPKLKLRQVGAGRRRVGT